MKGLFAKAKRVLILKRLLYAFELLIGWGRYVFTIILFIASIYYLNTGNTSKSIRCAVNDVSTNIYNFIATPFYYLREYYRQLIDNLLATRCEQRLFRQVASELQESNVRLQLLEVENKQFKELSNFVEGFPEYSHLTTHVVSIASNMLFNSFMIGVGARHEVRDGNAVINGAGLVGRIIETADSSARVLLITEPISRIPAMFLPSQRRFIANGNGIDNDLKTLYLTVFNDINEGDMAVTTGEGGVLPRGIKIGVAHFSNEGLSVQPSVRLSELDIVSVIITKKGAKCDAKN